MPANTEKVTSIDGSDLLAALEAAAQSVDHHAGAINALNVFPVPDGDTGTNMALTLRSASDGARSAGGSSLADVSAAMARGALMGARGNSGVILAQLLRGVARALDGKPSADARTLAAAFRVGADAAYTAVAKPVEGTILTVARAAAEAAEAAAAEGQDVAAMLARSHSAARDAVAATPEQLPLLKRAGVVDSGGEGYRVFLEGLLRHFTGEAPSPQPIEIDVHADLSSLHDENDTYGYCTEVLFQGASIDVERVRNALDAVGTSLLVVGDATLLKVHIHTLQPGRVLDVAVEHGEIVQVKVDNIQLQRQRFAADTPPEPPRMELEPGTGMVAVACGAGFRDIFQSLGATVVDAPGTMNPSIEQIVEAIKRTRREHVVVLSNDPNVVLASEAAARLIDDRTVAVVPTRNMPQGIAAALALNPEAELDDNILSLTRAAAACHAIALTHAVRDATVDEVAIGSGQALAFLDGRAVAAGDGFSDLISRAIGSLPSGSYEIATIYVGSKGVEMEAATFADCLSQHLSVTVEIATGGQPHYEYIISVE